MENIEAGNRQETQLPRAEQASWPEAFINPVAAAEKFKQILKSLGVEI